MNGGTRSSPWGRASSHGRRRCVVPPGFGRGGGQVFQGGPPLQTEVQLTSSAGLDVFPAFSPDGRALAYASDRSDGFGNLPPAPGIGKP
ncbi:MAG: PD40 domain-containing protein [Holophagales bacterium]|nr:PD40 domain-containing protein [Holophagales bacterium]